MLMGFFLFLHVFAGEHDGQKACRQDHTQAAESQQDDEQDQATYTWPSIDWSVWFGPFEYRA